MHESVDTSFTNGNKTIIETPSQRRASVPKPKRENAFKLTGIGVRRKILMFTPEEDKYTKAGLKRYGFGQWQAILRDPDFYFQTGRTANSLLSRAAQIKIWIIF